jgi:hypothetical protein
MPLVPSSEFTDGQPGGPKRRPLLSEKRRRYFVPYFVRGKVKGYRGPSGFLTFLKTYGFVGDVACDIKYAKKFHRMISGRLNKVKRLFEPETFKSYKHCMRKALKTKDFGNPENLLSYLRGKSAVPKYSPWFRLSVRLNIDPVVETWVVEDDHIEGRPIREVIANEPRGTLIFTGNPMRNERRLGTWIPSGPDRPAPFQIERQRVPLEPFSTSRAERRRAAETLMHREGDRRRKFLESVRLYNDPEKDLFRSIVNMEFGGNARERACSFARIGRHALYSEHREKQLTELEFAISEGEEVPPEGWADDEVIIQTLIGVRPEGLTFPRR